MVGDDLWHSSEHLLDTSPDVEVYVNDSPWDVFRTNDGERLLPFDEDREWIPLLSKCWGELSFIEEASMTGGFDKCTIGLVTDRIVGTPTTGMRESAKRGSSGAARRRCIHVC